MRNRRLTLSLISMFTALCTPYLAEAQTNTQDFRQRQDSIVAYLTPLEYAFMMHEETRFMLRLPVVGLGAEVELLPYFTFMAQAEIGYIEYGFDISGQNRAEGELRYYYSSHKTGVRNMSGNYVAAGFRFKTLEQYTFAEGGTNENTMGYYAKWGLQRRYLGNGLIDISLVAGYEEKSSRWTSYDNQPGAFLETHASLGLGLVFGERMELDRDRLCPVLKCFEKENWLFKINLANVMSIFYDNAQSYQLKLKPKVGVEKKIDQLPLSFDLELGFIYSDLDFDVRRTKAKQIDVKLEGRYYYNLAKRMRLGKSGNGLSANYLGIGCHAMDYESMNGEGRNLNYWPFTEKINTDIFLGAYLVIGVQRTFSNNFYFDTSISAIVGGFRNFYYIDGDIQVGLKF